LKPTPHKENPEPANYITDFPRGADPNFSLALLREVYQCTGLPIH